MTTDRDDEQDKPSLTLFADGDEGKVSGEEDIEEDGEEEESGDGSGDSTRLALDVPEPEQALAANEALAGKGKKPLKKGARGNKDRAGIDVVIGDALIGAEEGTAEASDLDEENIERSAFDSDEITDPDRSDIDPLMAVLGAGEKPWENESLTLAERMMMPGYERNTGVAGDQEDDGQGAKKAAAVAAGIVAGVAAGVAAGTAAGAGASSGQAGQGQNQDQKQGQNHGQNQKNLQQGAQQGPQQGPQQGSQQTGGQQRGGSGLGGIAKGPQSGREQDGTLPVGADIRKEQAVLYQPQNSATGSIPASKQSATPVERKIKAQNEDSFDLNMIRMIDSVAQNSGLVWDPAAAQDSGLAQAMNMIYASLAIQDLTDVSPDRRAGWDGMRQEHQENSNDMTLAADAPKPAMKGPEHKPESQPDSRQEQAPSINLGPGGV